MHDGMMPVLEARGIGESTQQARVAQRNSNRQ
jgi:hypothetical protein